MAKNEGLGYDDHFGFRVWGGALYRIHFSMVLKATRDPPLQTLILNSVVASMLGSIPSCQANTLIPKP